MPHDLLSVGRVARMAELSSETIRRLIDAGKLPAVRVDGGGPRLIERSVAEAFVQARAQRQERTAQ